MKLIIPEHVEKKINDYVQSVEGEIAGLGKVRIEGNDVHVEDVVILDQKVTAGTADLDTGAIAKFAHERFLAGDSKHWSLWWHSHSTMAAFFSGIDTATIDRSDEYEYMISLVVNKRQERMARLDIFRPFRVTVDKLTVEVTKSKYAIPVEIVDEVMQKVKGEKKPEKVDSSLIGFHARYGNQNPAQGTKPLGLKKEDPAHWDWDEDTGRYHWNDKTPAPAPKKGVMTLEEQVEESSDLIKEREADVREMVIAGQEGTPEFTAAMDDLSDLYAYYTGLTGEAYGSRDNQPGKLLREAHQQKQEAKLSKKQRKQRGKEIGEVVNAIKRAERMVMSGEGSLGSLTDALVGYYSRYTELTGKSFNSKYAQLIDAS